MNLTLKNESIDVFNSDEVFEHILLAYKAHGEIYRVMKCRGRHIFTVPFYQNGIIEEERAVLKDDGQVLHLNPLEYHDDETDFAEKVIRLYFDRAMWHELSQKTLTKLDRIYNS